MIFLNQHIKRNQRRLKKPSNLLAHSRQRHMTGFPWIMSSAFGVRHSCLTFQTFMTFNLDIRPKHQGRSDPKSRFEAKLVLGWNR